MNSNDYQKAAARTLLEHMPCKYSNEEVGLVWNALGLAGETGELVDYIKKGVFHEHGIDADDVVNELGDVLWYAAALCTTLGVSMGEVMDRNINKLKGRYPSGFSVEDSRNRG